MCQDSDDDDDDGDDDVDGGDDDFLGDGNHPDYWCYSSVSYRGAARRLVLFMVTLPAQKTKGMLIACAYGNVADSGSDSAPNPSP